jgi:hypothetical protein
MLFGIMPTIDVEKARKNGWIEAWFAIEVLGASTEVVDSSLKKHVEKMSREENVLIVKTEFKPTEEVKNPPKPLERGWSQVVNVTLFAKDLQTLINVVLKYGPSAIEIIAPKSKQINADEIQNIANSLAGLLHQFAAAGIGGMVITPSGN